MAYNDPFHLSEFLRERDEKGSLRRLKSQVPSIDFSSNDYLGFVHNELLSNVLRPDRNYLNTGSTGSRLISGNSAFHLQTEKRIAAFHHAEAALLFNSGYDANIGLLSSVPQKHDLVLADELIHASMHDGIRLGLARHYKFRHNDTQHLQELLQRFRDQHTEVYIVVESVYSMDGDCAPLAELVRIAKASKVHLIVDEAHAIGVYGRQGRGLCESLGVEQECFARVYTYGKAMGCHGAAVTGSETLTDYLVNFARSFIYTTALPGHSLACINGAYTLLEQQQGEADLQRNILHFNTQTKDHPAFIPSTSAIHCCVIPGNAAVQLLEEKLSQSGIFAKAIKSPTVKAGQERLRICLHAFNTAGEIDQLLNELFKYL